MRVPNDLQLDSASYLLFALFYQIVRHDRPSAAAFLKAPKSNGEIACRVAEWLGLAAPATENAFGWKATPLLIDLVDQQRTMTRSSETQSSGLERVDFNAIVKFALGNCRPLSLECEYCLVSVLKLVESLESFVFQRRRSDSLGRAADVDTEKPAEIRS
jgi:hypothetical protein